MKITLSLVALFFAAAPALAAQDCRTLAATAAHQLYALSDSASTVETSDVEVNPNNTSNGVSLIVTLNGSHKYLVLLSTTALGGRVTTCNSVYYVIAYPYANLIQQ